MRRFVTLLALAALALSACGHDAGPNPPPDKGSATAEDVAKEQARFDADRRPDLVVKALDLHPGSRVADIGAGTGLMTIHLARAVAPNGKVTATDVASRPLQLLTQRMVAAGLDSVVEGRVVAAETSSLEENTYDAILLAEVDNYFIDPVGWLRSVFPALKPGGRIVIENRIHHRAKSMADAAKAGLVLVDESNPVPTHFLAIFTAPNPSGSGTLKTP